MSNDRKATSVVLESTDFAEVKSLETLLTATGITWETIRVAPSPAVHTPTKRVMVAPGDHAKAVSLAFQLNRRRTKLKEFAPPAPKNEFPLPDEIWPPRGG